MVLRANVLCVKVKLLFIVHCLVLFQFASSLLSSMILIKLSLYFAFTMMIQLSYPKFNLHVYSVSQFLALFGFDTVAYVLSY